MLEKLTTKYSNTDKQIDKKGFVNREESNIYNKTLDIIYFINLLINKGTQTDMQVESEEQYF